MKRLVLIGGTMGIGKTTLCRELQKLLPRNVFLDGDWCWDAVPFTVTDETKAMVLDNIAHLLSNFLSCSAYENVLFCWVLHEQAILDDLLARLPLDGVEVRAFSLTASPEAVANRLKKDIADGKREADVLERSLARLPLYGTPLTEKLDTSGLTPKEAAEALCERL